MNPDFSPIVRALEHLAAIQQKGPWDYASTIAVILTLGVLIWYTVETYRLRRAAQQQTTETGKLLNEAQRQNEATIKLVSEASRQNEVAAKLWTEAQRQNEFSVMPLLAILLESARTPVERLPGGAKSWLLLRNVGNGPAFNVFVEPYSADNKVLQFDIGRTVLTPGEERPLEIQFEHEPHSTWIGNPDSLYEWINTGHLPNPLHIGVRSRSVTGIDYKFTFSFTPEIGRLNVVYQGFEVISSGTPVRSS